MDRLALALVSGGILLAGCSPDLDRFSVSRDGEVEATVSPEAGAGDGPRDADVGTGRDAAGDAAPRDGRPDGSSRRDADSRDADSRDAGIRDTGADARSSDAGPDGSRELHPDLEPADPSGRPCTTPGSFGECPSTEVCRFYTADESRCESCDPCGNLDAPCTRSSECDIVFTCFRGRCTNFCAHEHGCSGVPEWCVDVGHPTHGVCDIPDG